MTNGKFPCACCGCLVYDGDPSGTYWICPECGWEDDPVQNADPEYEGGANKKSLNATRRAWSSRSELTAALEAMKTLPTPPSVEERDTSEIPERE